MKITKLLIKYYFRMETGFQVTFGSKEQKYSFQAIIPAYDVWLKETRSKKIKSVFKIKWEPTEEIVENLAVEYFIHEVFGYASDYGDILFKLILWFYSKEWNYDYLTELDEKMIIALETMTTLTRMKYRETSNSLKLSLKEKVPFICILVTPMIAKIPVISMQYFLNIHLGFTFNSIRKSNHQFADKIISYLYEIMFLQQKIAISLHEYLRLIDFNEKKKKDALLINAEINAIMRADLVFSYLKASIEKIIVLIGLTFCYDDLNAKGKKHKSKIKTLKKILPEYMVDADYVHFVFEFIAAEKFISVDQYRTSLLHKEGIHDLQPHNFVGKKPEELALRKIFNILHEQHTKNTATIIGLLAMLTDVLAKMDPPSMSYEEIPKDDNINPKNS